mgnify:CR=1 FL=1
MPRNQAPHRRPPTGKADLHVHTSASDGVSGVREVLQAAQTAGIDVVAITDHNTIESAQEAQSLAPRFGVHVVIGEEISTKEGHLLALFLSERVPPNLRLHETIRVVQSQGGISIIAHPYDRISFGVLNPWRRRLDEASLLPMPFDGIEVFNACLVGQSQNRQALALGHRAARALVAGSDAHSAATVGAAYTLFPGRTAQALRRAILGSETEPAGGPWNLRQYLNLFGKRELRYAGVGASYAAGLCSAVAGAALLAVRSGITRLL